MKSMPIVVSILSAGIFAASYSNAEANSYTDSYVFFPGPVFTTIKGFDGSLGDLQSITIEVHGNIIGDFSSRFLECNICAISTARPHIEIGGEINFNPWPASVSGANGQFFDYQFAGPSQHLFNVSFDASNTFSSVELLSYFDQQYVFPNPNFSEYQSQIIQDSGSCSTALDPTCTYQTVLSDFSERYDLKMTYSYEVGVAVAEPSTWAIMICGLGLAGAALRRRRGFVAA